MPNMNSHAKQPQIRVVPAAGLKMTDRRGVAFIQGRADCITQGVVDALKPPLVRKQLYSRMGRWTDRPDDLGDGEKYHGWTSNEHRGAYVNCFVFKYRSSRTNTRLYGFLCNPLVARPRFQLFVATEIEPYKRENPVDTKFLDRAVAISKERAVIEALRAFRLE